MPRMLLVAALAFVAACGSSAAPTPAPTPQPANIAGGWSGAFEFSTTAGKQTPIAIVLDLTQAGSSVNGTYATQAFTGTVTGTTTPSAFSGTLTFNAQTVSGQACTGTMAVSGAAGSGTMNWTSP